MVHVKENHLEWALKHLLRFYDSDFYPKLFEFQAISHDWQQVKDHVLSLDLETYVPKSPVINLAPKPNGNYRIAHQLDPIDSLIYTALIREVCEIVEGYRIPEVDEIACSYRIKPDLEGSFFSENATGWDTYCSRSEQLSEQYKTGYVIVADITDFYNQIYTHRVQNLLEEAGKGACDEQAVAIENFLLGLNKKTSRGIPVGPAPSIVLAELIMASIDSKIQTYTSDFVRYVDDIRIFFHKREDAVFELHELTQYLYSYHRLVFSGEKTKIRSVKFFSENNLRNEEQVENQAIIAKAENLATEKLDDLFEDVSPYSHFFYDYDEEYEKALAEIMENEQFKLLSNTYYEMFGKAILSPPTDYALLRHLLRKAAKYRVRTFVTLLLDNFEKLLPVIREAIIYLNRVINKQVVDSHTRQFESILAAHYMHLPFVNLWVSYLLQNPSFGEVKLPTGYKPLGSVRAKALIALRQYDATWVRGFRDGIDVLGPWDKRAVLHASSLLPYDEMKAWVEVVGASGDIIDKAISSLLISEKKAGKQGAKWQSNKANAADAKSRAAD